MAATTWADRFDLVLWDCDIVAGPATGTSFVLLATVALEADWSQASVWSLPAVQDPPFPEPATSMSHELSERVVIEVVMSEFLVSVLEAVAWGGPWWAPDRTIDPAFSSRTVDPVDTTTKWGPGLGRSASSRYQSSTRSTNHLPTTAPTALVRDTPP
jgi:hypothetical protein